ncbi:MAG: FAD-binding protein [Flavobacteriales bacterium CG_4_10_14_0_2_um_filter_32_8]|nr:MAG: FAD-binding protein [Flavobacteriales bacterium CG_4_10_14_0_2_um_filter_32_8]
MQTLLLSVSPEEAINENLLKLKISFELRIKEEFTFRIVKRSIDARRKPVKINLQLAIYFAEDVIPKSFLPKIYQNVSSREKVIVVGFGPAGMFAALKLIELGYQPIVIERGKDVRNRRMDIAAITKQHIINPDSNYCFGEGGAGTFSDGKLYTRSKKRGDINEILAILVQHGAPEDILVDAHPHIGTNKLPNVVIAIRETIKNSGGKIHFNTKLTDLIINNNQIEGVITQSGDEISAKHLILATGHSARDIFYLLNQKGIAIESKPFAIGVRVEHPQQLIDAIQYHSNKRSEFLPPASYQLVQQVNQRGVFSFCMCPGGIIAPCATTAGEIVTNGWSPSKRNNPYANSGIVVTVENEDLKPYRKFGALAGLEFQKEIEQKAFIAAGNDEKMNTGQYAPAQRLIDFVDNKTSENLPECSYTPGIVSAPLHAILPSTIVTRLQEGFKAFGNKMRGFLTNDAIIVGVETRTSSPIKIPRDTVTLQHPKIKGLYPCGEGAGYAGGIVSAAIDGQKCAVAILLNSSNNS